MREITRGARSGGAPPSLAAGGRFWLWWVLASAGGWAAGGAGGVAAASSGNIIVAGGAGVALGGIGAGVSQWLLLRGQVARAGWWVAAIPAGAAAAGVAGVTAGLVAGLLSSPGSPSPLGGANVSVDVGWVMGAGLFGTGLGVLQWWLVLRGQVARAGWWVLASTVGWIAGGPATAIVDAAVHAAWSWAALGTVHGAVTGSVLVWLFRQPRPAGATA